MCHKKLILSCFVSCLLYKASSSNRPACLGSICRCIFFPFGMYPDGTFRRARQRRQPYFPGKNPSEVAGNGVSTPYSNQGAVWGKELLQNFYVILWFLISQKVAAYVFKRFLWAESNWFLKSCSWYRCFTRGRTKMPSFILASLVHGNVCLN